MTAIPRFNASTPARTPLGNPTGPYRQKAPVAKRHTPITMPDQPVWVETEETDDE